MCVVRGDRVIVHMFWAVGLTVSTVHVHRFDIAPRRRLLENVIALKSCQMFFGTLDVRNVSLSFRSHCSSRETNFIQPIRFPVGSSLIQSLANVLVDFFPWELAHVDSVKVTLFGHLSESDNTWMKAA